MKRLLVFLFLGGILWGQGIPTPQVRDSLGRVVTEAPAGKAIGVSHIFLRGTDTDSTYTQRSTQFQADERWVMLPTFQGGLMSLVAPQMGGAALGSDSVYAMLVQIFRPFTVHSFGIEATNAGSDGGDGSKVGFGLYDTSGNLLIRTPGTAFVPGGTSVGKVIVDTTLNGSTDYNIAPGIYYLAYTFHEQNSLHYSPVCYTYGAGGGNEYGRLISLASTSADLPVWVSCANLGAQGVLPTTLGTRTRRIQTVKFPIVMLGSIRM